MSFSSQVKNEISKIPLDDNDCVLCEVSSAFRFGGHFDVQSNGYITTSIHTENASFARRIIKNTVHNFRLHPSLLIKKSKKLKAHTLYSLQLKGAHATRVALGDIGLLELDSDNHGIFNPPEDIIGQECCLKSYIRGAFLASGSINHPDKSYHLEISSNNKKEIERLNNLLNKFGLKSNVTKRKNSYICYIKEGESIADFLNIIGAHKALMQFENVRILKGIRNNVNRVVNFENANLDKMVNASSRHVNNIKYIINKKGINFLDKSLQEIAILRMEHPHMTLTELGELLTPSLGKSGVNHRLKRIELLVEKLKENENDKLE